MTVSTPDAIAVARYVIKLAAAEPEPELVSHMRLQKLLYYIQGWHLAAKNRPAFESAIEAWTHGPVVRRVYPQFADYGDAHIAFHEASDDGLDEDTRNIIRSVWQHYKKYSAMALREMTHGERPWKETRGDLPPDAPCDTEISQDLIREYFEKLYDDQAAPGLELATLRRAEQSFREGNVVSWEKLREAI